MSNIIWKVKTFDELTVPELYAIIKARVDVFVVEQD
jgi:ElaA protein